MESQRKSIVDMTRLDSLSLRELEREIKRYQALLDNYLDPDSRSSLLRFYADLLRKKQKLQTPDQPLLSELQKCKLQAVLANKPTDMFPRVPVSYADDVADTCPLPPNIFCDSFGSRPKSLGRGRFVKFTSSTSVPASTCTRPSPNSGPSPDSRYPYLYTRSSPGCSPDSALGSEEPVSPETMEGVGRSPLSVAKHAEFFEMVEEKTKIPSVAMSVGEEFSPSEYNKQWPQTESVDAQKVLQQKTIYKYNKETIALLSFTPQAMTQPPMNVLHPAFYNKDKGGRWNPTTWICRLWESEGRPFKQPGPPKDHIRLKARLSEEEQIRRSSPSSTGVQYSGGFGSPVHKRNSHPLSATSSPEANEHTLVERSQSSPAAPEMVAVKRDLLRDLSQSAPPITDEPTLTSTNQQEEAEATRIPCTNHNEEPECAANPETAYSEVRQGEELTLP